MAVAKKKTTAKKAGAKKASSGKKSAAKSSASKKKAPAKKTAAKKSTAKKSPAKKTASKKSTAQKTPAKKAPAKKAPAKKTAANKASAKQTAAAEAAVKKPAATRKSAPPQSTPTARSSARKGHAETPMANSTAGSDNKARNELPKPRFNKDGLGYTKDFDLGFVKEMHDALQAERVRLTGQANRLEEEATQLVEEAEMGDVRFDDEGGEGDTMVVERERDLALSAQAREAVAEIDAAIERIKGGTYGYSLVSGKPIPRERLDAIPWSTELVVEKVGGIGR